VNPGARDGVFERPGERLAPGLAEPSVQAVERGRAAAQGAGDVTWIDRGHRTIVAKRCDATGVRS
jgi:hypothetical protein